jgi:hypothetical protein
MVASEGKVKALLDKIGSWVLSSKEGKCSGKEVVIKTFRDQMVRKQGDGKHFSDSMIMKRGDKIF